MPTPRPQLGEQHPASRRYAILDDDVTSAWLYLTDPDEVRPIADVFVYNRSAPAERVDDADRSRPPPIIRRFAAPDAVVEAPARSRWRFRWAADGDSVALERDGVIVALLAAGQRHGYSAAIAAACPWGAPLEPHHLAAAGLR